MSEYYNNCYELAEQLHRYKQAIDEIKYIINAEVKQNPDFWNDYVNISYEAFDKIIQKCEEVNVNN